jgi:3-phenylpropionate/trans-cinnamate dioxygenase ferredoxin subunit
VTKFVVGALAELPPGAQRRVEVEGRGIAIFNVDGSLYALRDICPHQGAPLSAGVVVGEVTAARPGRYEFSPAKHVRCPWHGWEYDLATGQSSYDPSRDRVRSYEVSVERGEAIVGEDGRVPGPFVADTVPISVENDYIVLEV